MTTQILHYKQQRDILAYHLIEHHGYSKVQIAKLLGISRQAVSMIFPNRKGAAK